MSRHGAVELDFGDGTHTFRLGLDEIEELEEKRDTSIFVLHARLDTRIRAARLKDISEVLRLGLIGGGTSPVDALRLVRRYVDERPLDENRDVAYAVVAAGLVRVHGGLLKQEADEGEAAAAKSGASTSPPSVPAQP